MSTEMATQEESTSHVLLRLHREYGARLYFDISPMLEESWTGIPVVTAQLAREFLAATEAPVNFFTGFHRVAKCHVEDTLARTTGVYLQRDCAHGIAFEGPLHRMTPDEVSVGLFPSVKHSRRTFDIECSVIHDVTTITAPQFHTQANVRYHAGAIVEDLLSNDVTFCISDATLFDIESYFGKDRFNLVRAYNGVCWPEDFPIRALSEFDPFNTEPYFVVLGTREPRKNIAKVLDLLSIFPDVCERYRFVIAGKIGWMTESENIPAAARKAIDNGQILFTGYVTEYEKYKLLLGAEATIYPSFLEGFGLPIIESLSVGTPCIASMSSSMPEVGGDACFYFDPFSVTDLYRVVLQVQAESPKKNAAFRERCKTQASKFSWTGTCRTMLNAIEEQLRQRREKPRELGSFRS